MHFHAVLRTVDSIITMSQATVNLGTINLNPKIRDHEKLTEIWRKIDKKFQMDFLGKKIIDKLFFYKTGLKFSIRTVLMADVFRVFAGKSMLNREISN